MLDESICVLPSGRAVIDMETMAMIDHCIYPRRGGAENKVRDAQISISLGTESGSMIDYQLVDKAAEEEFLKDWNHLRETWLAYLGWEDPDVEDEEEDEEDDEC